MRVKSQSDALEGFGAAIYVLKTDAEQVVDRHFFRHEAPVRTNIGQTSSGEIRLPSADLKSLFGVEGLQLLTDDGRLLDLKFAAKELTSLSESLHVDITGGLPATPAGWLH